MLNCNSILSTKSLILLNLVSTLWLTELRGAGLASASNTPKPKVVIARQFGSSGSEIELAGGADLPSKLDELYVRFLDAFKSRMSVDNIEVQLELHIKVLQYLLRSAAEALELHGERLAANDPATKQLYHNVAKAIHAVRNSDQITNEEQALLLAQIINTVETGVNQLWQQSAGFDLTLAEHNLKQHAANLKRSIGEARKTRASGSEIKRLQAKLETIEQAIGNLETVNSAVQTIKRAQTNKYDPRAAFTRWYLGIKLVEPNA